MSYVEGCPREQVPESQRHRQDLNELCGGLLAYLSIRLAPVRSPGQPLLLSAGNSTIPSISVPATRECLAVPCSVLVFCVLFSCSVFCSLVLRSVLESAVLCRLCVQKHFFVHRNHEKKCGTLAHLSGTKCGTLICRAGVLAPEHL